MQTLLKLIPIDFGKKEVVCPFCRKVIPKSRIGAHLRLCQKNPNSKMNNARRLKMIPIQR